MMLCFLGSGQLVKMILGCPGPCDKSPMCESRSELIISGHKVSSYQGIALEAPSKCIRPL